MVKRGIVICAKALGRFIPDDLDLERIGSVANCQGLGYVESKDHANARPTVLCQVSKQR